MGWAGVRAKWAGRFLALGVGAVLLQGGDAGAASRILRERLTLLIGLRCSPAASAGSCRTSRRRWRCRWRRW
ncbi:MAG: hypothetical protein R3C16_13765 [Hyphomonadaceae bacterium]